ncbi:repeatdomain containing protein [Pyrenophora tritici-repentis]|uniref:DUF4112 domain containing protein n=2 Tax=Pyrenophora tritici-repentis TaxID=45151 RepID=A0A2W1EN25_9PLEO|nr:uncharacterized protein PTRG_05935 [Pyrenophora tritici-repentis Pt-1C-BFP]KAA8619056.1 ph domain-containing protein [Pyrenophora tritici-repentis]EDU48855.1 conserved hypothetical protein [Pyrenophora tritici-repentis Pt-1C-BFP]KAF7449520.1 ph domain-containing protein [Pyrenophora tritici-repentis]KAF7570366.1 DUF4112 domain containing protein [Pyrenophora tritici-repentis]KAG9383537.1 ph domain-containing protein [Pyrenophora tritici-repentis]
MANLVAKYAMKKALGKEMEKYKGKSVAGPYDPFYVEIPHPTKPGKTKKVKKEIPSYIPQHDANVLAKARKMAYRLDYALFNLFGMRFGYSSVIGILPVVGDAADSALALNLVRKMRQVECGLPATVLIMMLVNIAIDFLVGLVPLVGDLADAAIKANGKNVRLLEEHLDKVYKPKELVDKDARLPRESRPRPASVLVDFDQEQGYQNYDDEHENVRQPQRSYNGRRVQDEEMGIRHDTQRSRRDDRPSRNNTRSSRR